MEKNVRHLQKHVKLNDSFKLKWLKQMGNIIYIFLLGNGFHFFSKFLVLKYLTICLFGLISQLLMQFSNLLFVEIQLWSPCSTLFDLLPRQMWNYINYFLNSIITK